MGRSSNRKKAQRQTGQKRRPDAATRQQIRRIIAHLQALSEETEGHIERAAAARRTWSGGTEPVPAKLPQWPEGSLGDRFFSRTFLREARKAPRLADAEIPDATVIAADPANWNVATNALVRAVAYDGLGLDHPAVSTLLEVLAPIAEAELAHWEAVEAARSAGKPNRDEDRRKFSEQDGPVFLLGTCVLRDAVSAAVGEDSLTGIRGVLVPVLDDAVPGGARQPPKGLDPDVSGIRDPPGCDRSLIPAPGRSPFQHGWPPNEVSKGLRLRAGTACTRTGATRWCWR